MSQQEIHHPPPRIAVLACDVLQDEIALHAADATHIVETRYFEICLHDRPDQLRAILAENLAAMDARSDIDAVVLVYGLCGRGTIGLRPLHHRMVSPRAHECITLFMGSKEAYSDHQHRCPTCYYYTPGWNRARRVPGPEMFETLRQDFATRFDEEDVEFLLESQHEQLAMHDTATYIDLGTNTANDEAVYASKCATFMGWKFERQQGDPTLLKDLLWGNWDPDRFLILEPGEQLGQATDESIMRAEMPTPPTAT